jgi:hypothetical protein
MTGQNATYRTAPSARATARLAAATRPVSVGLPRKPGFTGAGFEQILALLFGSAALGAIAYAWWSTRRWEPHARMDADVSARLASGRDGCRSRLAGPGGRESRLRPAHRGGPRAGDRPDSASSSTAAMRRSSRVQT